MATHSDLHEFGDFADLDSFIQHFLQSSPIYTGDDNNTSTTLDSPSNEIEEEPTGARIDHALARRERMKRRRV